MLLPLCAFISTQQPDEEGTDPREYKKKESGGSKLPLMSPNLLTVGRSVGRALKEEEGGGFESAYSNHLPSLSGLSKTRLTTTV